MKFFVFLSILLVLAVGCSRSKTISGNGRPGCRTEQEITDRVYRNFWDPTSYWVCSELNTAASPAKCDEEEAFQYSLKKCVSWEDWTWEPLVAPLSTP